MKLTAFCVTFVLENHFDHFIGTLKMTQGEAARNMEYFRAAVTFTAPPEAVAQRKASKALAALGAGSDVIALSVAAGLTKSVLVMIGTPFGAGRLGLNHPHSALIYGGLMGTTSGVAGGLAATDPKLVPYGAMTETFYTGMGCLLAPSLLYLMVRAIV